MFTRTHTAKLRAKKAVFIATICLMVLFVVFVVVLYVILPIVFMMSFTVQQHLMFTRFGLPRDKEDFILEGVGERNFYVDVTDIYTTVPISLGVWHLLPWPLVEEYQNTTNVINYDKLLANSSYDVVLHFHGTGETRRDSYRNMFIILRMFFHVIAFDYRGYGDSSDGEMTETAVTEDCKQLYTWLQKKTNSKIYIWGHSLGASLALRTAAELSTENIVPTAVMLEAAFTTMREEIPVHPYGQMFAWLPWLSSTILDPLEANGFYFNNIKHIVKIPRPILMYHAEDDSVIPVKLGQKLHKIAVTERDRATMGPVIYHQISRKYGCDHFALYLYPDLPLSIRMFLDRVK